MMFLEQTNGVVFEFYDAQDQVPPVACDRKGPHREPYDIRQKTDPIRDYHWTAALTARLLPDAADLPPTNKRRNE
jgi:hypothetical protein